VWAAVCGAAYAAASWVLPCRAAFGPDSSLYSFGVIPDEFHYAWRLQPLVEGATADNPVNRFHDAAVILPFFLDNLLRGVLTVTQLPTPWLFWIWRFAFPFVLAAAVWVAAGACLERRRPWSLPMRCAATLGGTGALCLIAHLVEVKEPVAVYLYRIPTNIEYPLAFLLAWAWLRLAFKPSVQAGVILAAFSALLLYLRPYAVIGWGPAIALHMLYRIGRRTLPPGVWLATAGTLLALLLPWLAIAWHNSHAPVYAEIYARYFGPWPYRVHPCWAVHLGAAALLAALAWRVAGERRAVLVCMAAAAAALPFISGLLREAKELLLYDRYGSFYSVALVVGALLLLGEALRARPKAAEPPGRSPARRRAELARRAVAACLVLSLGSCIAVAVWHSRYDFRHYVWNQMWSLYEDRKYISAYQWIAQHTPADALFLVDDGLDWSHVPFSGQVVIAPSGPGEENLYLRADHFQLIAHRQRVFNEWLWHFAISNNRYMALGALQRGTFGYPIPIEDYNALLNHDKPDYVFWRYTAPVPRGYGKQLAHFREVVYRDAVCEIWHLHYK